MITTTGLNVSVDAPEQGSVKIKQEGYDHFDPRHPNDKTSMRYFLPPPEPRQLKGTDDHEDPRRFFVRDRDLGQTFTIPPDQPSFRITAITLRVGPAEDAIGNAIRPGEPKRPVSLQLFSVGGSPVLKHDHLQPTNKKYDYFVGETYEPLWLVSGGWLPTNLTRECFLRWELPADTPVLEPGSRYGFLVMFDEPHAEQELAFANLYDRPTAVKAVGGHGIRREGSIQEPWRDDHFANNLAASCFNREPEKRLAQKPFTWGRPDVDTTRALTMYVEGD